MLKNSGLTRVLVVLGATSTLIVVGELLQVFLPDSYASFCQALPK